MIRNFLVLKQVNNTIVRLPTPANISYFWNFSSCLSLFLFLQIMTSVFLSMFYTTFSYETFNSLNIMMMDNNNSWLIRLMHTMGASFLMMLLYLHFLRSLFYKRFLNNKAWFISVVLMIMMMSTAFLSYVLPWGQMSFWSATVITNLITTIPYISNPIVNWLWSGFTVSGFTLNRFFSFHFILPFLMIFFSLIHLLSIHTKSSGNVLSTFSNFKLDFWPYYGMKDVFSFFLVFFFFFFFLTFYPYSLMDPENFLKANPSITPLHIKPEWYFLFAYAMLRCIPNKLMSVLVLVFSIVVFFFLPFSYNKFNKYNFNFFYKLIFFFWLFNFIFLTWLGSCPVKLYFNFLSQISSILYFFLLLIMTLI